MSIYLKSCAAQAKNLWLWLILVIVDGQSEIGGGCCFSLCDKCLDIIDFAEFWKATIGFEAFGVLQTEKRFKALCRELAIR